MSDVFSRISHINPTYPVRPAQPAQKDGDSDKRRKEKPKPETNPDAESGEVTEEDVEIIVDVNYDLDDDPPAIDEYV